MFHHSVPQEERDALMRSPLFIPSKALHAKYNGNIVVLEYVKQWDGAHSAVFSTTSGSHVAKLDTTPDHKVDRNWRFHALQHGVNSIGQTSSTVMIETKKDRYLIKKFGETNTKTEDVLKSAISGSQSNPMYAASSGMELWRSKLENPPPSLNVGTVELYEMSQFMVGEKEKIELSTVLLEKVSSFHTRFKRYHDDKENFRQNCEMMFKDKHKWVILCCALSGASVFQYFVGAVDTTSIYNALAEQVDGLSLVDATRRAPVVVPFDSYRSLDDVPEEHRNSLLGNLSMLKVYINANHSGSGMYDKDKYLSLTNVYEPSLGLINTPTSRFNRSYMIMFDK